jgi:ribosome-associated protein YbcJ (S4-like RNA binding protein)
VNGAIEVRKRRKMEAGSEFEWQVEMVKVGLGKSI